MSIPSRRRACFEQLERREVFAPLPVLMVIADGRGFFYQQYGDTFVCTIVRLALGWIARARKESRNGQPLTP